VCLPDLAGKRVLELGAGIGFVKTINKEKQKKQILFFRRFTKTFAQLAESVIAVDFMESFLEKNKEENSHYGTVEFLHQDATQLTFESNRYV
jgi:ubiquinone/menaquinone biosynthesis C-methylase UbiE